MALAFKQKGPGAGLGGWVLRRGHLGERRKAASNVPCEPITFRFPALSCFAHFSNLPQAESAFGPGHRV
jgi:hypothetical protein